MEYLIYDGINTYFVYYSELNGGWMYDIYRDVEISRAQIEDFDSDDGGLCTGNLFNAMEMAGIKK
jgi:hypothetical protein